MTQDTNLGYDVKSLMAKFEKEASSSAVNWKNTATILTNLGKIVTTLPEKAIDESNFLQMFAKFSEFLESHAEKITLQTKILIVKILQNSAIIMTKKQFITQADVAISIISDQFENECKKETPNVGYLITLLDAFFHFIRFQIGDNKEYVETINNLNNVVPKLSSSKKTSLRYALQLDITKNDSILAWEKDLRKLLTSLEIAITTTRNTNAIPPRTPRDNETRLKVQNTLLTYQPDIVLALVIEGFKKLRPSPNFKLSETVNTTIQEIMSITQEDVDYDMHEMNIETSEYIVEQGLEKMAQRMKFTSQKVQSHFLAMIICTTDQSEGEKYLNCTGRCTETAIRCASTDISSLLPFLINWVCYEYVKSPRERFVRITEKVAVAICGKLSEKDAPQESSILVFLRSLPAIDPSLFSVLADQVNRSPNTSRIIIFAMANVVQNTILIQKDSLNSIFELCISPDQLIRKNAIEIMINSFYAGRLFVTEIEDYSKDKLKQGSLEEDQNSAERYLHIFFEVLKQNVNLLLNLLEMYDKMNEKVQSSVRTHLLTQMPQIGFNYDIISGLFAAQNAENVKLIHFILDNLSKINTIPSQITVLIKSEFEKTNDGRFLIPIIQTLTETEFFNYIPIFLTLRKSGRNRAFEIYIMQKLKNQAKEPRVKLISELLKPIEAKPYKSQIAALNYCMSKKDVIDYTTIAAAVNKTMTSSKKNLDLICEPLLFIVDEYSENSKHVEKICQDLIKMNVHFNEFAWPKMITLFEKMNMFKIYNLPLEKIEEVAKKCPRLLTFMKNDSNKKKVPKKVLQLLETL
ncbi:hypothetical protein TVAG_494090 [Trichomonas vaginalis G3]|uniref:Symplekin C-terminal domain-containing protein n=1 Tax=Trichomonas vaginalis (strain ATCC PRA-98 / G3) TaxID=412133 RepID=A2DQ40_TRIV3|nr:symplekin family [Trichomonas vaginalis G3]EAY17467.1 hypothetical protein TVAG_494090 [Trichomonas vaginalis G3]KAI5533572.1 symplekin family [Trichomonas vaginalis G3]|eukprot:XP_001329602.1 hypothetical protein [Trichomonas vaginalis G3]